MSGKYLCNLLIPGAAKSGTSTLHALLDAHPQLCMADPKEPQFFSFDDNYGKGPGFHNGIFPQAPDAAYYGESSQCYFAHPHAIERMKADLDSPRIILALRHPVKRLVSQYAWNTKRGTEVDTLEKAVRMRGSTTEYVYDPRLGHYREIGGYLEFSRYAKWVPVWQDAFGADNVLVISFERLTADQDGTLRACFDFLGLPPIDTVGPVVSNATETTHRAVFPEYVSSVAGWVPSFIRKSGPYARMRRMLKTKTTPRPKTSMSAGLKAYLETELKDDIRFHETLV